MAMYELDGNHLLPVRLGRSTDAETRARGLAAIQRQVVDVLRRPLFPLGWSEVDHGQSLTALDATGKVVLVEVLSSVDAAGLMSAMSRLTAAAAAGRRELASRYAGGLAAFREDWNEFREAMPSQVESGPRLTLMAASLAPDVRSSMSVLVGSGVELYEVDTRVVDESRVVVVIEQVRMSDLGGGPLLVARPPRPGLTGPGTRAAGAQRARPQPVTGSIEVVAPQQPADPGQGAASAADRLRTEAVPEERTAEGQAGATGAADSTPVAGTAGVRDSAQGLQGEADEYVSRARGHRLRDTVADTRTPGASGWDGAAVGQHAAAAASRASRYTGDGEEQAPAQPLTPPSASTPPQDDTEAAHLAQAWPVGQPGRTVQAEADAVTRPTPEVAAQDAADLAAIARHLDGPTRIIWQGLRRGIYHEAVLSAGGIITLVDGRTFSDPTSAANAAQGVDDADGWRVWRLGVRGRQLGELREDLHRSQA